MTGDGGSFPRRRSPWRGRRPRTAPPHSGGAAPPTPGPPGGCAPRARAHLLSSRDKAQAASRRPPRCSHHTRRRGKPQPKACRPAARGARRAALRQLRSERRHGGGPLAPASGRRTRRRKAAKGRTAAAGEKDFRRTVRDDVALRARRARRARVNLQRALPTLHARPAAMKAALLLLAALVASASAQESAACDASRTQCEIACARDGLSVLKFLCRDSPFGLLQSCGCGSAAPQVRASRACGSGRARLRKKTARRILGNARARLPRVPRAPAAGAPYARRGVRPRISQRRAGRVPAACARAAQRGAHPQQTVARGLKRPRTARCCSSRTSGGVLVRRGARFRRRA
jgi:hypothetical protein